MFCGFGAVVLLVLLINSNVVTQREEEHTDLRSEVERLELELAVGEENLANLSAQARERQQQIADTISEQERVLENIEQEQVSTSRQLQSEENIQKEIEFLQKNIKSMVAQNAANQVEIEKEQQAGKKVRKFEGEGHRQYLTGFKLGGKRVLILLDSSASMLDRTVVNVIRRRVLDDNSKISAPKWQRAVRTVNWIMANLPAQSKVQLFTFNTEAKTMGAKEDGPWVQAADRDKINTILKKLSSVVPRGGTSLENCFRHIKTLTPSPDNIILITDGLPTQGQKPTRRTTISGADRVKLYIKAIKKLPKRIPVNTILLPMEGDPMAAMLFWRLAADSSGSFFTPTQDWP
jgi:hypothetical protein